MNELDHSMPRRAVLQGAGISTGLLSGFTGSAHAKPAPKSGEIWSKDYWAKKGTVKLNL